MQKRRLCFVVFVLVLIGVLVALVTSNREPEYEGRKLSEWVVRVWAPEPEVNGAENAIRHIGTNAIPFLLKWIQYEPSLRRIKWLEEADEFVSRYTGLWTAVKKRIIAVRAIDAFRALGPAARAAIPELIRLLNDPKRRASADRA